MASIPTHLVVGAALAKAVKPDASPGLMLRAAVLACLADLDVLAFHINIPYEATWGHRGATHSLVFAVLFAVLGARTFPALFLAALSHPLLDMMTDGGRGIAFLWPFKAERYFLPWRPIPVSPIGMDFFHRRGLDVMARELVIVWLPVAALLWLSLRHRGK